MPEATAVITEALIHRRGPCIGADALDWEGDSDMGWEGDPSRGHGPRGIDLQRGRSGICSDIRWGGDEDVASRFGSNSEVGFGLVHRVR